MSEDSFLGRWSRRKADARAGRPSADAEPAEPDAAPPAPAAAEADAADPVDEDTFTDAELLEKHGLPDPATLSMEDGVAAFMRPGVPARLRLQALRRMWRLDPVFANLDGLVDYDQDFSDKATVVPGMATVYRVGRGVVRAVDDLTRNDDAGPADSVEAASDGPPSADGSRTERTEAAEIAAEETPTAPPADEPPAREPEPAAAEPPRPRRMVFRAPDENDSPA